jgi:hypothetical protein
MNTSVIVAGNYINRIVGTVSRRLFSLLWLDDFSVLLSLLSIITVDLSGCESNLQYA